MKEIIVHPLPTLTTEIHDIPIPTPGPDELIIKVVAAGSNVKDWVHITASKKSLNSGDDVSGTVHAIGDSVIATGEFKIGDRVAGLHRLSEPGGAYAEYAVVPANTTFIIPDKIKFEEAATIPLVTLTAAISLFRRQRLPEPWSPTPTSTPTPLIIYGASSALGCYTIKLASLSNIHPIIAICGSSKEYVSTLLDSSKGDKVVDYRQGVEGWTNEVTKIIKEGGFRPLHAVDAISHSDTWQPLAQLLADHSQTSTGSQRPKLSVFSGRDSYSTPDFSEKVDIIYTYVGTSYSGVYLPLMPNQPSDVEFVRADVEFAYVLLRYIARTLAKGKFSGHPYEVVEGGLGGVEKGLNLLKSGKAGGKKFVYRIGETKGL